MMLKSLRFDFIFKIMITRIKKNHDFENKDET